MTVPQFEQLRAERREQVTRLAAAGLSTRQIAERLGISHVTAAADLKGPAMSTTTATAPPVVPPATRRRDPKAIQLGILIRALDDVGLTDQLTTSRELLAQAATVVAQQRADHVRARTERDDLVAKVAAGKLSLANATTRVGELGLWLAPRSDTEPTDASLFAERVIRQLHGQARDAARRDGMDVHAKLAQLAAAAVRRGVEAGGKLIDVPAVLVALRPPPKRGDVIQTTAVPQYLPRPDMAPLPHLALEGIQRDPARLALWGQASAALADLTKIHEVAEILHSVLGGSSALFGSTVDTDQRYRIGRDLPEPMRLAVFDALGWKPGLHLSLKPGERRTPGDYGTEVHGGVRYPVGWAAGQAGPRIGPALRQST